MVATGVTCELYVESTRVQDGTSPIVTTDPLALTGLSIKWGRETTVDQPEPSTLTFNVADLPGGVAFGDLFHVGSALRVTATGKAFPAASVNTFPDPGFETAGANVTGRTNATTSRSNRRARAGTWSTRIDATGTQQAAAVLAPLPFVADGTNPDAWDSVPATSLGQVWTFGASLFVPRGATAVVRPVLFTAPYVGSWSVVTGAAPLTVVGDGAWHDVSGPVTPTRAGAWVGLQVTFDPTGWSWDDVDPALAWDAVDPTIEWNDLAAVFVDEVAVKTPAAGTSTTVLVYAGRVTDLQAAFDDTIGAPVVKVTAADFTADLANVDVGDTPWNAEAMSARFNRILTLSGLPVTATIDASVGALVVSWRDVDRQPAMGLLAELGTSTDAVVWSAVHAVSGPYLRVEDPANRPAGFELALVGGVVRIIDSATAGLALSACDVLRDPVDWQESVGDVSTRVSVDYLIQGTDPGPPVTTTATQANVTVVDADREGYGPGRFGTRRYGVSTQLTTATDATAVANRIASRTRLTWRAEGITVDDVVGASDIGVAAAVSRMLTLLDGTSRNGLLLHLTDLPSWAPDAPAVGVYLEGGTYTFDDGRWLLALNVSNSKLTGSSAQWDQLDPAWSWDQFDPAITWDDLQGVAP